MLPYVGHPFFSPGWLLLPGFFCLLILALTPMTKGPSLALVGAFTLIVGVLPVAYQTIHLGWWQWSRPQREMLTQLQNAPQSREVRLRDCRNSDFPASSLVRVVGAPETLEELMLVLHGKPTRVTLAPCNDRTPASQDVLVLRWYFPELSLQ
jgi:hypothetical protein